MMIQSCIFILLPLIASSSALRSCKDTEVCISEKMCNDSGRGIITPRIDRDCDNGRICCELAIALTAERVGVDTDTEPSKYESCGPNMECVPRILCSGTEIDDSGRFIITTSIGPRIGDGPQQNCSRSLQKCCNVPEKLDVNPFINKTKDFVYSGCGQSNPEGLYITMQGYKDHESHFAEFPWVIAIMSGRGSYVCGGVLIHESLVLTAAHCVENHTTDTLVLRAGEWDKTTDDEPLPHENRRTKNILIHENFDNTTFYNDIALLEVQEPFTFKNHIQPICLPEPESDEFYRKLKDSFCYATGWGRLNYNNESLTEVILKKIDLPIVGHQECQGMLRATILGHHFRLRPSFLCAGGEEGKDTCKGDGGSPLFCSLPNSDDTYVLAGIVSWGIGCGTDGVPGVYANVPHLVNWIETKAKTLGHIIRGP